MQLFMLPPSPFPPVLPVLLFLPFPTNFLPQSLFLFPPLSLPPILPSCLPLILLFLMKGGRKHLGKGGYNRGKLTSSPELIDSKVFLKLKEWFASFSNAYIIMGLLTRL